MLTSEIKWDFLMCFYLWATELLPIEVSKSVTDEALMKPHDCSCLYVYSKAALKTHSQTLSLSYTLT